MTHIRILEDGQERYCGPFGLWYRHHTWDDRMRDLVVEAIRADPDQEVHSGREMPEKMVAVKFGLTRCHGQGRADCVICPELEVRHGIMP